MKNKSIATTGLIAALYVALTVFLVPISYGAIQVRVADSMYQLVKFDKKFSFGLIIGTAIANLFSPLGLIDVVFGTMTTASACFLIHFYCRYGTDRRRQEVVTCFIAALTTILVGIELHIVFSLPLLLTWVQVAVGQVVACIIGIPIIRGIEKRIKL